MCRPITTISVVFIFHSCVAFSQTCILAVLLQPWTCKQVPWQLSFVLLRVDDSITDEELLIELGSLLDQSEGIH